MHRTLALGVLLVFALSVQVPSENHQLISTSETETISAIGTPQVTSVSPKTSTTKTPTVAKAPQVQVDPLVVAASELVDVAKQIAIQSKRVDKVINVFVQDPLYAQNKDINAKVNGIKDTFGLRVREMEAAAQNLLNTVRQVRKASKKNS